MGAKERPTKVEVGQRWRGPYDGPDGDVITAVFRAGGCRGDHPNVPHVHYSSGGWDRISRLEPNPDPRLTYLGSPPSGAEGVRWERWLPPGPLPDTGPKVFKNGQVWAWRSPRVEGDPIVFRVIDCCDGKVEPLARPRHNNVSRSCWLTPDRLFNAVLIADVGCDPIAPEILYSTLTDTATGGPTPHDCEAPLPVVHHRFVGEKRDVSTGAPLTALQLIQARKPPEPYRPSIDEWDLLPDVDVRR